MARKKKGKSNKKKVKNRVVHFDKSEEKYNNAITLMDLKPWEKKYLRLLPWSYLEEGVNPKMQGHLNLFEPLKCEETLVRMDHHDVKAVLKIMGHNWPTGQKKSKNKKESKNWGTKAFDELVVSIGREEDELVSWWRRPYCMETVRKHLKPSAATPTNQPLFFNTYDEEQRLWGFAERMESIMFIAKPKGTSRKTKASRKTTTRITKKSARNQKSKTTKGKSGKKK